MVKREVVLCGVVRISSLSIDFHEAPFLRRVIIFLAAISPPFMLSGMPMPW